MRLYTYLQVREDAFVLYGFFTREDRKLFGQLLGVSGIGPKGALGILSALSADDLRFAVLADDAKTISKAPGVGLKTAKKLILELRDKLSLEEAFEARLAGERAKEGKAGAGPSAGLTEARHEAVEALTALGYSSSEALKAVRQVEAADGMDVEDILKAALKYMSF